MFNYRTKINHSQKVLTASQYKKLVTNAKTPAQNYSPVVKFFDPQYNISGEADCIVYDKGFMYRIADSG
jgi:hypothetical protein